MRIKICVVLYALESILYRHLVSCIRHLFVVTGWEFRRVFHHFEILCCVKQFFLLTQWPLLIWLRLYLKSAPHFINHKNVALRVREPRLPCCWFFFLVKYSLICWLECEYLQWYHPLCYLASPTYTRVIYCYNEYIRMCHRTNEHINTCLPLVWSHTSRQHVLRRHNSL